MAQNITDKFFGWYNKHSTLNITFATSLFLLQIIHLYWLSADVVSPRLIGQSFFPVSQFWQNILILVDYTEIPALISTSLIYIHELREKGNRFKNILFIILLYSQFLHIFWITDEFVISQLTNNTTQTHLPHWLAWFAIILDYAEVPVIIDTTKRSVKLLYGKLPIL